MQDLSLTSIKAERRSFILILIFSIISFLALTYQTYLFYFEGHCGCPGNVVFETYSVFWGIPISLIGMVGVGISITLSVLFLRVSESFPYFESFYTIFILWIIFQFISVLFVVNLMYISYVMAEIVCELCLPSQISAFVVFFLLLRILNKFRYAILYGEIQK